MYFYIESVLKASSRLPSRLQAFPPQTAFYARSSLLRLFAMSFIPNHIIHNPGEALYNVSFISSWYLLAFSHTLCSSLFLSSIYSLMSCSILFCLPSACFFLLTPLSFMALDLSTSVRTVEDQQYCRAIRRAAKAEKSLGCEARNQVKLDPPQHTLDKPGAHGALVGVDQHSYFRDPLSCRTPSSLQSQ